MRYYAGLDVSLEETVVCIARETGAIVREMRADSEPEALASALCDGGLPLERVGLEARRWRSLLVARRTVLGEIRTIENVVRALCREHGVKLGRPSRKGFAERVLTMTSDDAELRGLVTPLLATLDTMGRALATLSRQVAVLVRSDPVCQRLMTVPGVGPLTAPTFRATIDRPDRFVRSRDVGPHLGLTPRRYQSGETDTQGRISRCGDELARTALYEAAHSLLIRCRQPSALRSWGLRVARRRGMARARVALARKLGVVLHRLWADGTTFAPEGRPAAA